MSYLVLARKFRPQTFASVVGQDHITKAIANAIVRNRVPHAFLFTGPRGVGKTTTARLVARALNCTGRPIPAESEIEASTDTRELVEPCGTCTNCIEIARGSSIAVWEIDGASNNSVENVRELIDSLRSLPPPGANYKIYIIDEVHMLSVAAFNALLKSLEEPPPNTIFVFATTEPHKIPETVISRCQRHDFVRIPLEAIVGQLETILTAEGITADEAVLTFVARRAQGGMRDAQSMLDRLIAFSEGKIELEAAQRLFSVLDDRFCLRLSTAVFQQDPAACFGLIDEVFQQSIDVRAFVQDFLRHWRNLLLVSLERGSPVGSPREAILKKALEMTSSQIEDLRAQVQTHSAFDLQRLFDLAEETAQRAIGSAFPRFVLEAGLAKMATLSSMRPLEEVLQRIESAGIGSGVIGSGGAGGVGASGFGGGSGAMTSNSSGGGTSARSAVSATVSAGHSTGQEARHDSKKPPAATGSFDPSWQAFIAHVHSRRLLALESYLKRSTPLRFANGELTIEGDSFACEAMQDKDTLQALKRALVEYSGNDRWDVRFVVHQRTAADTGAKAGASESGAKPAARIQNSHVPGSLAEHEAREQN